MRRLALASAVMAAAAVCVLLTHPSAAFAAQTWSEDPTVWESELYTLENARAGAMLSAPGVWLGPMRDPFEYYGPGTGAFEPFSVQALSNGNVLITSRSNEVLEVTRSGALVWSYTRQNDNPDLVNTYSAQRLSNGNTLICDRRADFVIEVTRGGDIVWRYGSTVDSTAPGSLIDPFFAVRLANGNTLICDNRGGTRVIEVRSSDYQAEAPDLGYSQESIVWSYGAPGSAGTGDNQLSSPRMATRLANGNTLIVDSAVAQDGLAGNRVIEVDESRNIVWQMTGLDSPCAAYRLANGNTLIAEEGDNGRVMQVDANGTIVESYVGADSPGDIVFGNIRAICQTSTGSIIVADQGNGRVIEIGYELSGTVTSPDLYLGLPGVEKTISAISVDAFAPSGTSVSVAYSLDGGDWVSGGTSITLPEGTTAERLRYRVTLASNWRASTPVLRDVSVTFDLAVDDTTSPAPGSGETSPGADASGTVPAQNIGDGANNNPAGQTNGSAVGTGTLDMAGSISSGALELIAGNTTFNSSRYAQGTVMQSVTTGMAAAAGLATVYGDSPVDGLSAALVLLGVSYIAGMGAGPLAAASKSRTRTVRSGNRTEIA